MFYLCSNHVFQFKVKDSLSSGQSELKIMTLFMALLTIKETLDGTVIKEIKQDSLCDLDCWSLVKTLFHYWSYQEFKMVPTVFDP